MYAKETIYKVVETEDEKNECLKLIAGGGKLNCPTVIAIRNNKIIGLMTSIHGQSNILANSLTENSIFVCMRLSALYESILKLKKIPHYLFSVKKDNKKMIKTVERLFHMKPFSITGDSFWYVRRL